LQSEQRLGVAERHGHFQMMTALYLGEIEHRIDQAGSAAVRDVAGFGLQSSPGWFVEISGCVDVGGGDGTVAVENFEVLVRVLMGHDRPC
jgi:hypothetical protein